MDKKELKFKIAQRYKISETEIDESVLPIFVSLMQTEKFIGEQVEKNQKSVASALAEYSKTNEQLSQKIKGSITTHQYAGTHWLTAFTLRWGWGFWVLLLLALLPIFWLIYKEGMSKGEKYEALEKIIQYDPITNQYFIDAKDYQVRNNKAFQGIIIHNNESKDK